MTLLVVAAVLAASLAGPLLAWSRRVRTPVIVGELVAGVVLGRTGAHWVHANDAFLSHLATAGFALVMMVAGSHVPLRDVSLRLALRSGTQRALGVGVLSIPVALAVSTATGVHHTSMYAVLMASSSAAYVMPVVDEEHLSGDAVLAMLAQVAVADTACIVVLPLVMQPHRAARAAVGAAVVGVAAFAVYVLLRWLSARGSLAEMHEVSAARNFGLELRVSLAGLFALAGLAQQLHVSVMLAGFATGLVLSGLGTPRRLAIQLFAVTDGFLGPVFFVWLGAGLDLRSLATHPRLILLGVALAVGALAVHAAMVASGQPTALATLASAQLGVPVAAATIGGSAKLLVPGEAGALLFAALVTVAAATVAASRLRRSQPGITASEE